MDNKTIILNVNGIEVIYNHVILVLKGVSLQVPERSIVAILGGNGAGKTTTLRAVSNLLRGERGAVTKGSIELRGERIENRAPHRVTALGIVLVPERSKVFENLSVAENLEATVPRAARAPERRRLIESVYEYFPPLARLRAREAGLLSGGERQMLAIGTALACGPELLLVDELSLGLAPLVVQDLAARLRAIRDQLGITILLVEQNFAMAKALGDRVAVMDDGRVVHRGPMSELAEDAGLQHRLLGLSLAAHQ